MDSTVPLWVYILTAIGAPLLGQWLAIRATRNAAADERRHVQDVWLRDRRHEAYLKTMEMIQGLKPEFIRRMRDSDNPDALNHFLYLNTNALAETLLYGSTNVAIAALELTRRIEEIGATAIRNWNEAEMLETELIIRAHRLQVTIRRELDPLLTPNKRRTPWHVLKEWF